MAKAFQPALFKSDPVDMLGVYTCSLHGDFQLSHYYQEEQLDRIRGEYGYIPCP